MMSGGGGDRLQPLPLDVAAAVRAEAGGGPPDLVRQRVLSRLRHSTAAAAAAAVATAGGTAAASAMAAGAAETAGAAAGDFAATVGEATGLGAGAGAGVGGGAVGIAARMLARVTGTTLGKAALLVALVGGGAGLHALWRSATPSPAAIGGADAPADSRSVRRSLAGQGGAAAAGAEAPVPSTAAGGAVARRQVTSRAGRLSAERALLDRARRSLLRRDGDGALVPLARHASGFPRGQLVEEREGMWVKALVIAGRPAEARARAETFRRRFPHSLFLPAVDAALRSARR